MKISSFYNNPYNSCYPLKKYGYLHHIYPKSISHLEHVPKEQLRYFEIIKKSYAYAYKISIENDLSKMLNYIKIGYKDCANEIANRINDVFYFMQYITNTIYNNKLYNITTCKDKKFLECLRKYWYCKRIDITPIIKEFELEICKEEGIDYMVIIDPLVNPTATPPNKVE